MLTMPTFRRHKPLPPQDVWQALRRDAFVRSGGRCQCADCGRHKGQCAARLHEGPGGFACDHVIPRNPADPRVPQGPDVPANLRAVCSACNREKSNRITALPEGPLRRRLVTAWLWAWLRRPEIGLCTTPMEPINCPHQVTYRLELPAGDAEPPRGTASEALAALRRIKQPIGAARVVIHAGVLSVEVPLLSPPPVPMSAVWSRGLDIGVGIDGTNRRVGINLADSPPHLAIAGGSGSGKSTVLRTLALGFARGSGRLILCDSDADTWAPFARAAALLCAVAEEREDIDAAVALAYRTMCERRGAPGPHAPVMLAIDEVQVLADGDQTAMTMVRKIAAHGRKFGVLLAVATQHPTAKYFERGALVNCRRASGRVVDAAASKAALGLAGAGAERLSGKGDMLVVAGGQLVRFRACLPVASDFARLPQADKAPLSAPREVKAEDTRHQRKPVDEQVVHLVERWQDTGQLPSAKEAKRAFGGGTTRAMRARDTALAILGS